jgi:hypothetical protein
MHSKHEIAFAHRLETGMLSEMLILDVLSRIGEARIPQLAMYVKRATRNSRVPFFLGKTVRDVLRQHERLRNVQIAPRGTDSLYTITPLGRKQLGIYQPLVERLYPSVLRVPRLHTPTSDSRSIA